MSEPSDGLDAELANEHDGRSDSDGISDTSPDLDAIAATFDEIEQALRRLDNGTYFSPDVDSAQSPAPTSTVGSTSAG